MLRGMEKWEQALFFEPSTDAVAVSTVNSGDTMW